MTDLTPEALKQRGFKLHQRGSYIRHISGGKAALYVGTHPFGEPRVTLKLGSSYISLGDADLATLDAALGLLRHSQVQLGYGHHPMRN